MLQKLNKFQYFEKSSCREWRESMQLRGSSSWLNIYISMTVHCESEASLYSAELYRKYRENNLAEMTIINGSVSRPSTHAVAYFLLTAILYFTCSISHYLLFLERPLQSTSCLSAETLQMFSIHCAVEKYLILRRLYVASAIWERRLSGLEAIPALLCSSAIHFWCL